MTNEDRAFGKPENIEKRLAMWHRQLKNDSRCPIHYRGMIDDLSCASRMLGGDPDKKYPDMRTPKPAPKPEPENVEYDL